MLNFSWHTGRKRENLRILKIRNALRKALTNKCHTHKWSSKATAPTSPSAADGGIPKYFQLMDSHCCGCILVCPWIRWSPNYCKNDQFGTFGEPFSNGHLAIRKRCRALDHSSVTSANARKATGAQPSRLDLCLEHLSTFHNLLEIVYFFAAKRCIDMFVYIWPYYIKQMHKQLYDTHDCT